MELFSRQTFETAASTEDDDDDEQEEEEEEMERLKKKKKKTTTAPPVTMTTPSASIKLDCLFPTQLNISGITLKLHNLIQRKILMSSKNI